MRATLSAAATLLTLTALAAPAAAQSLNPQPLPPGRHVPTASSALNPQPLPPGRHPALRGARARACAAGRYEPPDPCFGAAARSLNPQPLPPGRHLSTMATSGLNPQPLPPGRRLSTAARGLNPQPLPPGRHPSTMATSGLNPQPLPPGRHPLRSFHRSGGDPSTSHRTAARPTLCTAARGADQPPDPCLH